MSLPNISPASPALSNATTTATGLGNLALVVPIIFGGLAQSRGYQPQNPPNVDGSPSLNPPPKSFLFDYEGEQTTELTSDVTDHFIEDNTAIQDQIALKPVRVTTKGFVSELNDIAPAFLQALKSVAQKLTVINSYVPGTSATAQLAYNQAFQAYQTAISVANSAVAAWNSITGNLPQQVFSGNETGVNLFPNQTKQQLAFSTFYGYWISRTLFTIQTPWATHNNMVIERLHPIQSEDTQMYSTFEITFKQIRTVQSGVTTFAQGRLANSKLPLNSSGTSTPPFESPFPDNIVQNA